MQQNFKQNMSFTDLPTLRKRTKFSINLYEEKGLKKKFKQNEILKSVHFSRTSSVWVFFFLITGC